MAYDENSVYNKYGLNSGSEDSSSDCGCGDTNDCSCCPPGTVGVYNEKGEHVGCLTPNDAEIYNNALHIPIEGFVKVIHPVTGKYLGDLPPAQAIEYINFLSTGSTVGAAEKTFNILEPLAGITGFLELSYALGDGETNDITLLIDRVGIVDAVIVSIQNSTEGVTFAPSGTVTSIPLNSSEIDVKFKWSGIIAVAGTYTFILRFATTLQIKEVPVRLTLS